MNEFSLFVEMELREEDEEEKEEEEGLIFWMICICGKEYLMKGIVDILCLFLLCCFLCGFSLKWCKGVYVL